MERRGVVRHMSYSVTEQTMRQRLANKVRHLRTKRGLTPKASAARAEMHWRHWQKIEAADVSVTLLTLVRLSDALNVEPCELIDACGQKIEAVESNITLETVAKLSAGLGVDAVELFGLPQGK